MSGFVVANIGCIECGVSSGIVGVFATKDEAERIATTLNDDKHYSWREGGQHSYEVFALVNPGPIAPEYGAAFLVTP